VRGAAMKPLKKHLSIQLQNGRYSSETNFKVEAYNCFIADQICFLKGCNSIYRNLTQDIMWFLHVQVP